jgi:predicted ArsR family transcriptional regulator
MTRTTTLVPVTNKQLSIYLQIESGVTQLTQLANDAGVAITTVQRHTDALRFKGLIVRRGQHYYLTDRRPAQERVCNVCHGRGTNLEAVGSEAGGDGR